MSFQYFDLMEEIFGKDKETIITHSSNLPKKNTVHVSPKNNNSSKEIKSEVASAKTSSYRSSSGLSKNISLTFTSPTGNKTPTEKKDRLLHESGSKNAKVKIQLEKQWLEHLQCEEKRREEHDAKLSELVKKKRGNKFTETTNPNKQEKDLENRKMIAEKKLKSTERRHNEIMAVEKEKCKLLQRLLNEKENIKQSNDSDNI